MPKSSWCHAHNDPMLAVVLCPLRCHSCGELMRANGPCCCVGVSVIISPKCKLGCLTTQCSPCSSSHCLHPERTLASLTTTTGDGPVPPSQCPLVSLDGSSVGGQNYGAAPALCVPCHCRYHQIRKGHSGRVDNVCSA